MAMAFTQLTRCDLVTYIFALQRVAQAPDILHVRRLNAIGSKPLTAVVVPADAGILPLGSAARPGARVGQCGSYVGYLKGRVDARMATPLGVGVGMGMGLAGAGRRRGVRAGGSVFGRFFGEAREAGADRSHS